MKKIDLGHFSKITTLTGILLAVLGSGSYASAALNAGLSVPSIVPVPVRKMDGLDVKKSGPKEKFTPYEGLNLKTDLGDSPHRKINPSGLAMVAVGILQDAKSDRLVNQAKLPKAPAAASVAWLLGALMILAIGFSGRRKDRNFR